MSLTDAGEQRYTNPVYDYDAPDPTLIQDDAGAYHCFTTQSIYDGQLLNLPHLVSPDLIHWTLVGDAMSSLPRWVEGSIWAPHADRIGDRYLIYYSAKVRHSNEHAVGVQSALGLYANFVDRGAPLVRRAGPSETVFAAIDPYATTLEDGRRLLYWGSGHAPIRASELTQDGMDLQGPVRVVLEPFEVAGGYGRLVEAAGVHYSPMNGFYYLWVSGDNTHVPRYAISEFRSKSPDEGFNLGANPDNPILRANDHFVGPGHHSLILDDANQWWVLYQASAHEDLERFRHSRPGELTSAGLPGVPRKLMLDRVETTYDGWSKINGGRGPSWDEQVGPRAGTSDLTN